LEDPEARRLPAARADRDRQHLVRLTSELAEPAEERVGPRVGFDAAALPARASGRVGRAVDVHVTDLTREAARPRVEEVTEHQAAADARAQRDHEEARVDSPVAVELLSESGRRRVVLDGDGAPETLRELLRHVDALEAGDVGEPPATAVGVHLTG